MFLIKIYDGGKMNTSRKIFESLKKNSNNEYVSDFLQELFVVENKGLYAWNSTYDELIEKYCEGYLNED